MDWFQFGDLHVYLNPKDFAQKAPAVTYYSEEAKLLVVMANNQPSPCTFCIKS